ncbi:MAG TPA: hypothetical protein VIT85_00540 [Solirubrobacterales bacterium]
MTNLARDARGFLRRHPFPPWADGILVGLAAWQIEFVAPGPGLDPSWHAGLYMAAHQGLDFGTDVVFTYGPLGYLDRPSLWYSDLAVHAFLYSSALYLTFTCTLVWTLSRMVGRIPSAAIAFVFLATAPSLEQISLVVAVAWALGALQKDRPRQAMALLVYGGATLSAVHSLVKLSLGPPIFLVFLIALVGVGATRRQWLIFLSLFLVELCGLWLITGQSLSGLPDYVIYGEQIISGYNEAMRLNLSEGWEAVAALLVSLILVGGSFVLDRYRSTRARWCGVTLMGLTAFVIFKYAVVRFESTHVAIALSTALAIWMVIPWSPRRLPVMLTGIVAIGLMALPTYTNSSRFDPIANLTTFTDQVGTLLSPGKRQRIGEEAKFGMQAYYAVSPEMLARLKGKKAEVEPWETAVAWTYDLDWSPLPVFQNYSAYTSELDDLNSEEVEDPDGPQLILRAHERIFEGRNPVWDPPEQNRAIVCNFSAQEEDPNWQLLVRTGNRCGEPTLIASFDGDPGEVIEVPVAREGELVFARIQGVPPAGFDKLRAFLWRPGFVNAYSNENSVPYRIIPGTAADGMVLSMGPGLDTSGSFAQAPWAQLPIIEDIRLEGIEEGVTFDFYRVEVGEPKL